MFDQSRARLWMTVPNDWRKSSGSGPFNVFFDDAARFGELLPRPDLDEIGEFYEVEKYYTHGAFGEDTHINPLFRIL